jgi:hypothetical protein
LKTTIEPDSLSEHLERLLELETDADNIRAWHPGLVPGLLQSVDYAAAAIATAAPALAPEDVADRAAARTVRVDTLGQAPGRSARYVIAEEVLYRPLGGAAVLAGQLEHLLTITVLRPSLELRVLPTSSAGHPGLAGEFTLYRHGGRATVFVETLVGGTIITRPEATLAYSHAYDHVEMRALSPAASLRLIEAARSGLGHA